MISDMEAVSLVRRAYSVVENANPNYTAPHLVAAVFTALYHDYIVDRYEAEQQIAQKSNG